MTSREQFEAWHKGLKAMLIAAGEPTAARHCENLKVVYENAWIASREAIVIELPEKWGEYTEAGSAACDAIDECKQAIEAAGLKTK